MSRSPPNAMAQKVRPGKWTRTADVAAYFLIHCTGVRFGGWT